MRAETVGTGLHDGTEGGPLLMIDGEVDARELSPEKDCDDALQ